MTAYRRCGALTPFLSAIVLAAVTAGPSLAADATRMAPVRAPAAAPVAAPPSGGAPAPGVMVPPAFDLAYLKVVVPAGLFAFTPMTAQNALQVVVANNTAVAAPPFPVKLTATFVNVPQTPTPPALTGAFTVPNGIPAHGTVSFAWPQNFAGQWLPGEYRLQIQIDPANQLKEANEANNNASITFTVPLKPGTAAPGAKGVTGAGTASPASALSRKALDPQPEPPAPLLGNQPGAAPGPAASPRLNPQPEPPSPQLNPQPEPPVPSQEKPAAGP